MDAPRGAVPHVASRRSAHAGRELEKSLRLFKLIVVAALVVLIAGTLLAIASLPDERSTAPAHVGPSVQFSRDALVSLPASRSLVRPSLARSVAGVNRPLSPPTQGVTSAALQTAARRRPPAVVPSRPAPATEHLTSPSPSKVHSVPTRSPAAVPVGGTASGPTASQWATLRRCESGGLYGNKQNPNYRGAYQIGFTEWASYGGTGYDPADAPPAEQDAVALRMWHARGWQPWSSSSKCTHLS
ncbi:MAG TPA: transglycosylase family protein [Acidothermaceae bacterium]|nr:transglycosylase family protein [Acidothermaceae bacterium]